MKILLTNDDGIFAPGLTALLKALPKTHEITVVAPDRERSAVSHGISLLAPLRIKKVALLNGYNGVAVSGTPVDCVKIALTEVMPEKPDLVISGINAGANTGNNINYSGTVAAAREAALYGVPAVASSMWVTHDLPSFEFAAEFTARFADWAHRRELPFGTVLNVNFPGLPKSEIAGIRFTRQGLKALSSKMDKRYDPHNQAYFWYKHDPKSIEFMPESDDLAVKEKYISITPIRCDLTEYDVLDQLKEHFDWPDIP